jgi:predicted DCC family thiol-disulfide oxidoreductase YuxK
MVDMRRTTAGLAGPRAGAVLVFDGDCGFCTSSAATLRRWADGTLTIVAWQCADLVSLGLTGDQCATAVQYVGPGVRTDGADAIGQALQHCRQPASMLGRLIGRRAVAPFADRAYRLVAAHRHRLPGATSACRSDVVARSRHGVEAESPRAPEADGI